MAQTDWVFSIESKIYTIIKTRLLKANPNIFVTQEQRLNDTANLPSVFIKMLDSPEIGADLEGSTINAMLVTFETHITVTKDMGLSGMRRISAQVLEQFKKLRFQMATRGEITRETSDTYVSIARYRRVIGGDEEINF